MFRNRWKAVGIALLVLGTGAAVMAYQASQGQGKTPIHLIQGISKVATATTDSTDWVAGWPELTAQPDDNPMTKTLLKALERPISMNFPEDTMLSDVVNYIRTATISPELPNGLNIYVDPVGLQEADKTMVDMVRIRLEGIPLKTTLRLLLKQLSLTYTVKDGTVTITSISPDEEEAITPFGQMEEKAMRGELSREHYKQLIEALKLKIEVLKLKNEVEKLMGDEGE